MIRVNAPDGTVVNFPDGTAPDIIKNVMRQRFGGPETPAAPTESRDAYRARIEGMRDSVVPSPGTVEMNDAAEVAMSRPGGLVERGARALIQGTTFGAGDEITARLASLSPNMDYETALEGERNRLELQRQENPVLSYGAEIAGSMAVPIGAVGTTGNLGSRALKSGGLGAALGGVYGFLSGEGGAEERADNALGAAGVGGTIGVAIPVAGSAIQRIVNAYTKGRAIPAAAANAPTTAQLRQQGQAAYRAIDDAGVQINPQAFSDRFGSIVDDLASDGLDQLPGPGSLTPKSARVVQIGREMGDQMAQDPTAALPFSSLDQLRRQAGNAAADTNAFGRATPDSRLGAQVVGGLDDFVENLTPADVTAGDLQTLQTMIPKARELWGRMSRSQMIDDAIGNSENYLSGTASGLRNQFARILRNPQMRRGFDESEIAAIRRVVNGSIPEKLLYLVGGGLGNLGAIGVGTAMGGPVGFLAGAGIAAGTRKAADAVASRNADIVRALVANNGLRNAPPVAQLTDETRNIVEQLMRQTARTPAGLSQQ